MTSDIIERLGLWEPCPCAVSVADECDFCHSHQGHGVWCQQCHAEGHVQNAAAVRAAWAVYDWLRERKEDVTATDLMLMLEAAGAERPKE